KQGAGYKVHGDANGNGRTIAEDVALRTFEVRKKHGMARNRSEIPETRGRQLQRAAVYGALVGSVIGLGAVNESEAASSIEVTATNHAEDVAACEINEKTSILVPRADEEMLERGFS